MVVFTAQISILIKGGGGGRWEGEGGAGLSDNVINGVCLPGNGGGGGRRLTDVHAVICARGGSGRDIGREGWAVAHQAWGSGTAGYSEGTVGMPMDGWGWELGIWGTPGCPLLTGVWGRPSGLRALAPGRPQR